MRSPFAAAVGAALYVCSAFAVHRISQVDSAFAVLILQPLGVLLLRRVRPGRAAASFLGFTAIVVGLLGFTFLQEAAYILIYFGMYVCYRLVSVRDWRPFVVLAAAGLVGILLTLPRLGTVVEDIRETSRTATIQGTCPCELLRWFDDGSSDDILGKPSASGTWVNLHEGFQLYTSTFAATRRDRDAAPPPRRAGDRGRRRLRRHAGAPREADRGYRAGWCWCARRRIRAGSLGGGPAVARAPARHERTIFVQDPDLRFYALFVVVAFAVVLSEPVRYLVYLAFFRVDFTHARISAAALLPLCTLAAVFVHGAIRRCGSRYRRRATNAPGPW